MTLLRYNPRTPWGAIHRLVGAPATCASWKPAFDISENDDAFVLRGDLPGMAQKDIEVRVEDGSLTVRGERAPVGADERSCRCQRPGGKFARRFWLPDTIDAETVEASYKNGVLELTLPKREQPDKSRLVPIN